MAKKIKLNKKDCGRFVRIEWDNEGAEDGIITEIGDKEQDCFGFLSLMTNDSCNPRIEQIVKLGHFVSSKNSGL